MLNPTLKDPDRAVETRSGEGIHGILHPSSDSLESILCHSLGKDTPNKKTLLDCPLSGDLEVTVDFLTEVDKLVQLIECPIFTCKSLSGP